MTYLHGFGVSKNQYMLIVWVPFNTKLEFNFDKNLDVKRILNYSKTKLKKPHNIDSSTQANNLK